MSKVMARLKEKPFLCFFFLALILELFVFNFRSFSSLFLKEHSYPLEQLKYDGWETAGDGTFRLTEEYDSGVFYVWKLDELLGEEKLKNLRLDIELPGAQERKDAVSGILRITPMLRDEGHDQYETLADHIYRQDITDSRYLWLSGSGQIRTVTLKCSFSEGDTLRLKGIVVNSHRPLQFSLLRLLLMLIIPALAYLLRRGSRFRQEELSYPCRRADLAALILGLILLLPSVVLTVANENAWENEYFRPYQQLSEAFAAGQLSLVETPPAALAELENPYDFTARTAAGLQMDTDYLWDTAWYRGKYYVYFGVIPCLLFYFPYYLLLGKHLSDAAMVIFCAVFCYSGIWLCLREYLIRKEKKLPAGVPLILTALVYLGSGMMTDLGAPNAHNIPRDLGLVLILWGLFLWQRSLSAGGKKRGALLAAGSLLMALAVGCRPNLALYSFLALPLFYKAWKEAGGLRKKEGLSLLGELLLPYVPVALGLMIYNALRFGSPFDFGMSYNLTVRDYSHNNVFSDRIAVGIWEYLFRPAQTEPQFPFLGDVGFAKLNPLGQGSFYYTAGYGGLFACNILMFFLPGLCTGNKKNGEGLWLLGLSFVNMIANICLGGVAYHYRVDFAAEMLLAAAIGALEIHGECGKKGKEVTESILLLALALSWLYHIRFAWTGGLAEGNTELYYRLFYAMRI